jgi:alkylation response protein AidB-like acyl-CoA dehydrogenase
LDAPGADVYVAGSAIVTADVAPVAAYDATRSLGVGAITGTVAELGVDPHLGLHLQWALLAAESVGGAQGALQMARDYAVDRHAFGRAIGSYQAVKHKLVEMLRRTELARSLLVAAGHDWGEPRFALSAAAARVAAAQALDYAAPENIFIHGGIGATWEHDAQLYYRRAELSRRLAGGAEAAAEAVADELLTI